MGWDKEVGVAQKKNCTARRRIVARKRRRKMPSQKNFAIPVGELPECLVGYGRSPGKCRRSVVRRRDLQNSVVAPVLGLQNVIGATKGCYTEEALTKRWDRYAKNSSPGQKSRSYCSDVCEVDCNE